MAGTANQDTLTAQPLARVSGAEPLALFLTNEAGVRAVPLPGTGSLTIGRGSEADLRINDHEVSRAHLRIELSPALRVVDLGSANGTFVRGERIAAGQGRALSVGDVLEIGTTLIVLRRQAAAKPSLAEARVSTREHDEECGAATPALGDEMRAVLKRADRVACSHFPILIFGETGVGKDVLAERIHRASPRARAPFLRLNCASFSASLLESELFGHQKGAFTGATMAKQGLLQSAEGGTVLLDEVGELPSELQAKLLLVVERREVFAVGAERARPIDVRFIAATHRDLPARIKEGAFREDLYHRLNGVPITIPPLRRRGEEIADLAQAFVRSAARSLGRPVPVLGPDLLALLHRYQWPGNVRELRATMERVVVLSEGDELCVDDLRECLDDSAVAPDRIALGTFSSERERIAAALAACAGNQSRAARMLGMSRNTLIARLKKYEMARPIAQRESD